MFSMFVFVGYALIGDGYLCFEPSEKRVYTSRDVCFIENDFSLSNFLISHDCSLGMDADWNRVKWLVAVKNGREVRLVADLRMFNHPYLSTMLLATLLPHLVLGIDNQVKKMMNWVAQNQYIHSPKIKLLVGLIFLQDSQVNRCLPQIAFRLLQITSSDPPNIHDGESNSANVDQPIAASLVSISPVVNDSRSSDAMTHNDYIIPDSGRDIATNVNRLVT